MTPATDTTPHTTPITDHRSGASAAGLGERGTRATAPEGLPPDWYTAVTGHPPTSPADPPDADRATQGTPAPAAPRRRRERDHSDGAGDGGGSRPGRAVPQGSVRPGEALDSSWRHRALAAEHRVAELENALGRRPAIEQAKGLLMGVFGLEAEAAFDVLVWTSQHANNKLYSVAEQLVAAARAIAASDPRAGTAGTAGTADTSDTSATSRGSDGSGSTALDERLTRLLHELIAPPEQSGPQ